MANHKQTKKRIRQTETRTTRNKSLRSKLRTFVKGAEQTIASTVSSTTASATREQVAASFKTAMSELHKAVTKGLINKKTASRKISRLAARIRSHSAE